MTTEPLKPDILNRRAQLRVLTALVMSAVMYLPAAASDTSQAIAAQVHPCWNPPPDALGIASEVTIELSFNSDGSVAAAEVSSYTPDDDTGYSVARSAYRAILSCGPYATDGASSAQVILKTEDQSAPEIPKPGTQ